ncbi:MAG: nitrate reductase cytochrome c-type subunit [Magnetococcales bacterium]|nr:nitrate reductase cytochrome c-type subunit [Magnetococcales bacterium]
MKRQFMVLLSAFVLLGMSGLAAASGIVSLRGDKSLFADEVVAPDKPYLGDKPGKQKVMSRAWNTAPPQIPHTQDKMVILKGKNTCLECHDISTYEMAEAPVMGESHYKDRTGKALDKLYQGRYNCSQCHVQMVDGKPLVGNTFKGIPYVATKKVAKKKAAQDDIF